MAGSVNKVILVGNAGKNAETFNFEGGGKVVSFSLATSESWRDQAGQKAERVTWHDIKIVNEHLAGIAEQYVKKGSKVYVEGQIESRKFTDRQGVDREVKEVVLRFNAALELLDRRESAADRPESGPAQQRAPQREPSGRR
jgi:single-strand DNA-binding protein